MSINIIISVFVLALVAIALYAAIRAETCVAKNAAGSCGLYHVGRLLNFRRKGTRTSRVNLRSGVRRSVFFKKG